MSKLGTMGSSNTVEITNNGETGKVDYGLFQYNTAPTFKIPGQEEPVFANIEYATTPVSVDADANTIILVFKERITSELKEEMYNLFKSGGKTGECVNPSVYFQAACQPEPMYYIDENGVKKFVGGGGDLLNNGMQYLNNINIDPRVLTPEAKNNIPSRTLYYTEGTAYELKPENKTVKNQISFYNVGVNVVPNVSDIPTTGKFPTNTMPESEFLRLMDNSNFVRTPKMEILAKALKEDPIFRAGILATHAKMMEILNAEKTENAQQ